MIVQFKRQKLTTEVTIEDEANWRNRRSTVDFLSLRLFLTSILGRYFCSFGIRYKRKADL